MEKFIENREIYFHSEITDCMRMDAIKENGEREFICGIDVFRMIDNSFLITSVNGICGSTFLRFVRNYNEYVKGFSRIPKDCKYIVFADDSEGIKDKIDYIKDYESLVCDLPQNIREQSNL